MAAKKPNKKPPEKKLYKKKDEDKSSVKKDLPGKADDKKPAPAPGTKKDDDTSPDQALIKIANLAMEANKAEDNPEEREEKDIDEEEDDASSTATCRCMEIDGDYYCFKMKQGRWVQFSLVPHPTKKICEASCCPA